MNPSKLEHNFCRICLDNKTSFNWNDEIFGFSEVTYKDCYYKYTQLEETDADCYSTNLCDKCANEVKNAHTLFEKALKSFIILQNSITGNGCKSISSSCNGSQEMFYQPTAIDENNFTESNPKKDLQIDELISYSPVYDDNIIETEKSVQDCKESVLSYDKSTVTLETPHRTHLENQPTNSFDINLFKTSGNGEESKGILRSLNTALQLKLRLKIRGSKLLKSIAKTHINLSPITLQKNQSKFSFPVEKIQSDTKVKQDSHPDQSFKNVLQNNTESQQWCSSKIPKNNVQKNVPLSYLITNVNIGKSDTNSFEPFNPKFKEQRELENSFLCNVSGKEAEINKLSDRICQEESDENYKSSATSSNRTCSKSKELEIFSLTEKSIETENDASVKEAEISKLSDWICQEENDENFKSSIASSNINCSKSKDSQTSSSTEKSIDTVKDAFKPSEISLLEKIYGKNFNTKSLKNIYEKKPYKEDAIICQYCSKVLTSKYKAIQHEKTHAKNRERTEVCTQCGMKFFNKEALKSHKLTHNENREKRKCEFCDKAFYNTGALNIHRRIHLGQMIKCTLCAKEYFRQVDLDKHMISHSAAKVSGDVKTEKKYFVRCEICEENVRSRDYKSHYARHINEPLAKCTICNKEFFSRASCAKHLNKVHKKENREKNDFIISYKTKYYSKLFVEQTIGPVFTQ